MLMAALGMIRVHGGRSKKAKMSGITLNRQSYAS